MQRFFDSLKKGFLTTGALFFAGYKPGKTRLFQSFQHFFGIIPVGEGPHLHPEQAVSLGLGRGLFRLGRNIGHPRYWQRPRAMASPISSVCWMIHRAVSGLS